RQPRRVAGLPPEPLQRRRGAGQPLGQHLQGHLPPQLGVARAVDLPHPAAGEVGEDFVLADPASRGQVRGKHATTPASRAACESPAPKPGRRAPFRRATPLGRRGGGITLYTILPRNWEAGPAAGPAALVPRRPAPLYWPKAPP